MASILKEVFANRNVASISLTSILMYVFHHFWRPWQSLYLLELGASKMIVGAIAAAQTTTQMTVQLPIGMLTDRFGRKKILVYSHIIRWLSIPFFIFARTCNKLFQG